jgi:FlaA1/EpsC-like NDP-sugar epimerase
MRNRKYQSVIVFGAADAGRLALACLRGEPDWEIVAFADGAPRPRATECNGLPVVPSAIPRPTIVDRIVVSDPSDAHAVPQLRAPGIAVSRIDLYQSRVDAIEPLDWDFAGQPC